MGPWELFLGGGWGRGWEEDWEEEGTTWGDGVNTGELCSRNNVRKRDRGNELNCLARDPWRLHLRWEEKPGDPTSEVSGARPGSAVRLPRRRPRDRGERVSSKGRTAGVPPGAERRGAAGALREAGEAPPGAPTDPRGWERPGRGPGPGARG